MEIYEVQAAMKYDYYAHKDDWEQTRLLAYIIAQANSTKKLKLSDIMEFYWEKDIKEPTDTYISDDDVKRLKEKAKQYLNK